MTGNCSRCGRVETLFEIESSGERICGRCITSPLLFGQPGYETPPAIRSALPPGGIVTHARTHYTEIPGCAECIEARRRRA